MCLLSLEQSYNALEVRFQEIDHAYHETYHWLLEDGTSGPGLARRLRAETGIFWIQGLPGSGKSTCMKWIYENPTTRSILDAAGFSMVNVCFTDRKSDVERSWRTVLASMLYQILRDREVLLELVEPFGCAAQTPLGTPTHPAAGQPTETIFYDWTINNLQEALMKCKEQTELPFKLCFFIDALDESDESVASAHAMVHFLDRLVSKKGDPGTGLIKVCTASRPETELEDLLHYRSTFQMQDWTGHDIRRFVTTKLQAICDTPHVVTTERDWNELHQLEEEIIQEARGVFLWVRLVVEYISDRIIIGTPVNEVREKVGRIPNDQISHFFRHMLEKIRGPETKIEAYVMLEAVRRARKPLTLTELALTVRTDKCRRLVHKADFEVELQPTDLLKGSESGSKFEKKIRQATKGLLQIHRKPDPRGVTGAQRNVLALESDRDKETIDPNTCTVQLMHQTVKEFLEEYHYGEILFGSEMERMPPPHRDGHLYMLCTCLAWLKLPLSLRTNSGCQLDTALEVPFHAAGVEQTLGRSCTRLLDRLDQELTDQHPLGEGWLAQRLVRKTGEPCCRSLHPTLAFHLPGFRRGIRYGAIRFREARTGQIAAE